MTKQRIWRISILIGVIGALTAATYVVARVTTDDASSDQLLAEATAPPPGVRPEEIDRRIDLFEERVAAGQGGVATQRYLGLLYFQKARFTDDIPAYFDARSAYEAVVAADPDDLDSLGSLARVALAVHDFATARDHAERVYQADPTQFDALLVLADVAIAVGDYDSAETFLADLDVALPDQPVIQTRLARLTYLNGNTEEALVLAAGAETLAEERGLLGLELSFYRTVHGRIAFEAGRYDLAADRFGQAVAEAPEWTIASAGLAQAKAAQGSTDEALRIYRSINEAGFDPPFVAALAELLWADGMTDEAQPLYDAISDIGRPTGIDAEVHIREYAVIYADLDIHPEIALEAAEAGLVGRADVEGYDILAWALYRNGRFADAREASDRARALETASAPMLYHAGLISAALGETDRAIGELRAALDLSPRFDPIQAGHARQVLEDLGGGSG